MTHFPRSLAIVIVVSFPLVVIAEEPHRDLYGDPLPPGAIQRLGTVRLRHDKEVTAALFLPDGKTLVTASRWDQTVRFWDTTTGEQLRCLRGLREPNALALSPDGKTFAVGESVLECGSAAPDNVFAIVLFDVATGNELNRRMTHPANVNALAFGPDGKQLFSGCEDGYVRVWNLTSFHEEKRVRVPGDRVTGAFPKHGYAASS